MDFGVLGRLDVKDNGRLLELGGRQRKLLAILLVHANDVVSTDRLVEALWGERPPPTAQTALQVHVSQLRKVIGADRIETRTPGYRLRVARDELDSARFEHLLDAGDVDGALALWHGRAFAEFEDEPWAAAEAARLEELRVRAEEARFERALAAGEPVVAELEALVRAQPLRERPRAQLMHALYQAGRQADALALFQETRRMLVEELGIEPGPELQELHRRILNQDPSLAAAVSTAAAAAPRAREERKIVTVLFCDLVGFTTRAETLDPEDVDVLLSRYHVQLRAELERHGGTVEKFVGDAVLALFGAPVAHEDDAERAVRAALAIRGWIAEADDDLHVRIGVATGEALVRLGASPAAGEAMAVGDVVNTAARLQQVAPQGAILVGEQTYRATRERIAYDRTDPVQVKGKAEPLPVWLANGIRVDVTDAERPTTPFVGRARDLSLLEQAYERCVHERSPQLVTIVGEPGIGKTRLLSEFRAFVERRDDDALVRHGRCLAYGDGITFWALGEIVKAQAGILESDPADVAAAKLAAGVDAVAAAEDRVWLVSQLGALVGAAHRPAAAGKEEAFTAWRTFLEAVAARQPLVLLVEDVHWADPALLEFLESLVEWAADAALIVVATARPELYERAPEWAGGKRNATTLALAPLSDEETSAVVEDLLRDEPLDPAAHALLLERAGGNPLYAEEFVRLVRDRRLVDSHDELRVPEGVQAVIAARLDTLPPERKALIHAAAVVGKVFWAGALAAITRTSKESVLTNLHELGRKELIRRTRSSSIQGDVEYLFWHVLVRDVAYAQIPRAERSRMHVAAADWIERNAGERFNDHAEFLAHHYRTALELRRATGSDAESIADRAVEWTARAGDRARTLDPRRASAFYREALELLAPDDTRRAPILVACADAEAQSGMSDLPALEADVLDAIDLYRRAGNEIAAADALRVLSFIRIYTSAGIEKRLAPIREALAILERHPPTPELAKTYERLVLHYTNVADYSSITDVAPRTLELLEQFDLRDEAALIRSRLLTARARRGGTPVEEYDELIARVLDPDAGYGSYAAFMVLQNGSAARQVAGAHIDDVADCAERAIALGHSRGLRAPVRFVEANSLELLYATGRWSKLVERARGVVDAAESPVRARVLALGQWARTLAAQGDERAAEIARRGLASARELEDFLPFALVSAALGALAAGERTAAGALVAELERAIEVVNLHLEDGIDFARACAGAGRPDILRRVVEHSEATCPFEVPIYDFVAAVIAEDDGDVERAAAQYERSGARWDELGYVWNHALSRLGAARCRGDAASVDAACALFERLGASTTPWRASRSRRTASSP